MSKRVKAKKEDGVFDEMTKDELVVWVKRHMFMEDFPKMSDVLFLRWERLTKENQRDMDAHVEKRMEIDYEKYNEYVKQFNASEDIQEKGRLAGLMIIIQERIKLHRREWDKITSKFNGLQKLYDRIDVERKKEIGGVRKNQRLFRLKMLGEDEHGGAEAAYQDGGGII